MRVNVSINDFSPLLRSWPWLFKRLRHTGVDGVELAWGWKTRWASSRKLMRVASEYDLPIKSVHQPLWSSLGLWFDKASFYKAKRVGATFVTCHPLPKIELSHPRMQNYLDRLSKVQQETGVRILLENLPQGYNHPILKRFFPTAKSTRSVPELRKAARDFGLGLTLDIDHIGVSAPHKEPWFQESLLDVENIHLSSFDDKRRHMPLGEGGLDAVSFLRRLNELRYKGLLTLEVNDPKAITLCSYSFDAIARSAHVVHRVS